MFKLSIRSHNSQFVIHGLTDDHAIKTGPFFVAPELLQTSALATKMDDYDFFDYQANEALLKDYSNAGLQREQGIPIATYMADQLHYSPNEFRSAA